MVVGLIGIFIALVFLIYMVMKGWPLLIVGAIAALIVCLFNGINLVDGYLTTYMSGVGGFLTGQIPIFLWGAVFGELYGTTGAASSIAKWISRILRGRKEHLSPLVTIVIVFLAGILLSYGGVSAIVLMFVMTPLTLELCRESGIPRYMVPGMILGCIATAALSMPGSPQVQNVVPIGYLGTTSMAAAVPGFIAGILILALNVAFLNFAAKKEMKAGNRYYDVEGDVIHGTDEKLPNPILSLIPMVIVFVLFNGVRLDVNFSLMIGIIAAFIIFFKHLGSFKDIMKSLGNAASNTCIVSCGAAAVAGFGTIVAATSAFGELSAKLATLSGSPLLIGMMAMMLMTMIGGSGPAGLASGLPMFQPVMAQMGVSMSAFHRISAFAATTFDTLPTNAGFIAATEIAKVEASKSYKYVGVCTVLNTTIGTVVLTLILMAFPALA